MTELLFRSIKLSYQNSDSTIDELLYQHTIDYSELYEFAEKKNDPLSEWCKVEVITQPLAPSTDNSLAPSTDKPLAPSTDNNQSEEPNQLRLDLDTAYNSIISEVTALLTHTIDMSPKDLKDLVTTLKIIEDIKFPKTSKQGLEVDLKNGIVRYLATNSIDDL